MPLLEATMGWRTVDRTNGIIRLLQFTLRSERVICILVYIYIHMRVCVYVCVRVYIYIYIYVCVDILHCILYIYAIKSQLYICCIHSPNHLVHFRTHDSYHLHEKNPSETSSQQLLIQLAIQAPHRLRRRGSPGAFGVQGVQRRRPRFGGK